MSKNIGGVGQGPFKPSREKINERQVTNAAFDTDQPLDRSEGVDVSRWRRVLLSVHPVTPNIAAGAAIGWAVQIRVWRWKLDAQEGTGRPTGQWYAEADLNVAMDGDVTNAGPMEYAFPTWDSEKMHFQVIGTTENPDTWTISVGVYGLVRRFDDQGNECCAGMGESNSSIVSGLVNYHDDPVIAAGVPSLDEAKDFDGAALPNSVAEGDAIRPASTLYGARFVMPVTEDGADTPVAVHDRAISASGGGTGVMMAGAQARAVQLGAVAEDDAVRLIANLYGELVLANYIWATQANRTEEDDPIDTRDVGDVLADDVDLGAGTTDDYYLSGAHYAGGAFHFIPDPDGGAPDGNTQLRIYAALRDDGTAPNALEYVDKTNAWFGAAPITTEQLLRFPTDTFIYFWHFEVTRPAGTGTEDYSLFTRRAY